MSSTNTTATKFVWASVAAGKKKTLAEAQAETERVAQDAAEAARLAKLRAAEAARIKEDQLRKDAAVYKADTLKKTDTLKKADAAYELSQTRERGCWENKFDINWYICLNVPHTVNERSLKFVVDFLANYRSESQACQTVGAFRQLFYQAFVARTHYDYPGERPFIDYMIERRQLPQPLSPEKEYKIILEWKKVKDEIHEPWRNSLWVFVQNVTFENCLWAMCDKSETFKMDETATAATGFIQIKDEYVNTRGRKSIDRVKDRTEIVWLTDLATYKYIQHRAKPACYQKRQREDEEYDNWLDE